MEELQILKIILLLKEFLVTSLTCLGEAGNFELMLTVN